MTAPRGADAAINRGTDMPINEELRLECLRLAMDAHREQPPGAIVSAAGRYYDFVTGTDRAALTEQAKAAVDALR